uniref:Uncharacterized protein n=1 Tax=Oryza sativa subsp. japonica TaxID=39947 RepID=Q6ENZ7_ORYSJ|nr:hypothetical protein [Oryza sativa Japonica Group]
MAVLGLAACPQATISRGRRRVVARAPSRHPWPSLSHPRPVLAAPLGAARARCVSESVEEKPLSMTEGPIPEPSFSGGVETNMA